MDYIDNGVVKPSVALGAVATLVNHDSLGSYVEHSTDPSVSSYFTC